MNFNAHFQCDICGRAQSGTIELFKVELRALENEYTLMRSSYFRYICVDCAKKAQKFLVEERTKNMENMEKSYSFLKQKYFPKEETL